MPLAETRLERQSTSESLRQHYSKPPIQEVILEVKADLPDQSKDVALLRRLEKQIDGRFVASRTIDEKPNDAAEANARIIGQEFRSANPVEIVRAKSDGFSFHKLPPYTSWEEWKPRAAQAFDSYRKLVHPKRLTWASVRYVNRILVPTPAEMADFFLTYPEIGRGIPQSVAGFYMQATIPHASGTFIILRQAMIEPDATNAAAIILDIQTLNRLTGGETPTEIDAIVNKLHEIEIDTFEHCITNRTRELFQ